MIVDLLQLVSVDVLTTVYSLLYRYYAPCISPPSSWDFMALLSHLHSSSLLSKTKYVLY